MPLRVVSMAFIVLKFEEPICLFPPSSLAFLSISSLMQLPAWSERGNNVPPSVSRLFVWGNAAYSFEWIVSILLCRLSLPVFLITRVWILTQWSFLQEVCSTTIGNRWETFCSPRLLFSACQCRQANSSRWLAAPRALVWLDIVFSQTCTRFNGVELASTDVRRNDVGCSSILVEIFASGCVLMAVWFCAGGNGLVDDPPSENQDLMKIIFTLDCFANRYAESF